ncbi:MAG: SPFH domain-containing protein [Patescibacteria group bacterium]|jgi:regulator of protease activity HflC (stomatin/prohibitin superfamily)
MLFLIIEIVLAVILAAVVKSMPTKAQITNQCDGKKKAKVNTYEGGVVIACCLVLMVLVLLISSLTLASSGTVNVATLFGKVEQSVYPEGMHFINPMYSTHNMSVRRLVISLSSEQQQGKDAEAETTVQAVSKDNLPIDIDVTYAFRLNPTMAWWVFQNLGTEKMYIEQLMKPVARNATRDATVAFTSDEATTSDREGLAKKMTSVFEDHLRFALQQTGLDENKAGSVFTILPVVLRKALPPKPVLDAIALKAAAKQDLERQTTLTQIAEEIAKRRANEGKGVSNLFSELPKDFKPADIAMILYAVAAKENADAVMKLAESENKPTPALILGSGTMPVSVASPQLAPALATTPANPAQQ